MYKFLLCALVLSQFAISAYAQPRGRNAPALRGDTPAERRPPAVSNPSGPPPSPAERAAEKAAAEKAENEVVRVETNLVTTPVSVMDRNGRFVPGLKKKDFKIFEDGVAQQITYFQSEEQPFTVVLLIDVSPSTRYRLDEIHYAAVTFVNQLRPADKVMVAAFDQRLRILTEPTTEKSKLFAAIYKSQFGSGTSLYDAVSYVSNLDLAGLPGRKAVVIFTDGVDTTSRATDFASSLAEVEEVDALFYPIRYNTQRRNAAGQIAQAYGIQLPPGVMVQLGRGQSEAEYQKGKIYLETLAANSGGRIFDADAVPNLEVAFQGVAEELRRQYAIGYYASEDGKAGDRKRIKIQVTRPPRAIIRSKTTYIVKDREEATPSTQPSTTL